MRLDARRLHTISWALLPAAALAAALLLAGQPARGQGQAPPSQNPPAPPAAPPAAAPPASPATPQPAPAEEPPLRIIRTVCTDHICGHCDGKCHKDSGHVAVDKKGHCACTPTEGSALDRATRDAYEKNQPK